MTARAHGRVDGVNGAVTEAARVEGLRFRYGREWALDGVSLVVHAGEALAVLGPNGAGKSTLIGNMLGLLTPTEGTVTIDGVEPARAVQTGRVAGMLQGGSLPPFTTVAEVLHLIERLYTSPRPAGEAAELA